MLLGRPQHAGDPVEHSAVCCGAQDVQDGAPQPRSFASIPDDPVVHGAHGAECEDESGVCVRWRDAQRELGGQGVRAQ